ncbi:DUF4190 domain-containing protein [Glycomyces sp. NPDC048151]|uniref:DUF4190 domain-containing protein n=1 Tax=Glycomyces sp. NPDC048151 TaxID=3364002 RepID=UPI0037133912
MTFDPYAQQQPSQPPGMQPPPPPMPAAPGYPQQQVGVELNGKAVAALVTGVLFCTGLLGIIPLVLGKNAEREINMGMGIGRPMAKAGRILGWIGIAFTLVWIAYFIVVITAIIGAADAVSDYSTY